METNLKKSIKVKRITNYVLKCNFIFALQYDEYCSFLMKNANVSRTQVVLNVIYIFFESSLVKI